MFTGIVENVGELLELSSRGHGFHIKVKTPEAFAVKDRVKLGDSIACNGVCLTATYISSDGFEADVSSETVACTTFKNYRRGQKLNLELACAPTTHLGGHIVQGHVDGIGLVVERRNIDDAVDLIIKVPNDLLCYIAPKGSIAVDGVSLTVNGIDKDLMRLTLIPHTQEAVNFSYWIEGSEVNLEADVLARYLERLMTSKSNSQELTYKKLLENGFV